eukprot:TRINITY_DN18319_c0_g1_i1.p1 TRINITY_DN18319_c0_g1~~TRINITY_DN18319_c0_g1_i1.p1  ORF type:complete len:1378 (-),score=369.24 TRINITY_DN18319_c0_g1_i1:19-4152(-)
MAAVTASPVLAPTAGGADLTPARMYSTKGKDSAAYAGPRLQEAGPEDAAGCATFKHNCVAFIGNDGTAYDVAYSPVGPADAHVDPAADGVYDVAALKSHGYTPDGFYLDLPSPDKFNSYAEFEEAVVMWRTFTEGLVGYAQLPTVMGRHYCRPKTLKATEHRASFVQEEEEVLQRQSMAQEDEEALAWLRPLTCDPWEAVLMPREPSPFFYESYQQYETAMKRWAKLCVDHVTYFPPHPAQLETVIHLHPAKAQPVRSGAEVGPTTVIGIGAISGKGSQTVSNTKKGYRNPHVAAGNGVVMPIHVVVTKPYATAPASPAVAPVAPATPQPAAAATAATAAIDAPAAPRQLTKLSEHSEKWLRGCITGLFKRREYYHLKKDKIANSSDANDDPELKEHFQKLSKLVMASQHVDDRLLGELTRFIKTASINTVGKNKQALLHNAAYSGNNELIGWLTEHGANVHLVDETGWTPLMASLSGGNALAANKFLAAGAFPYNVNNRGHSMLHVLLKCQVPDPAIVDVLQVLLAPESLNNVNFRSVEGETALLVGCVGSQTSPIKSQLLEALLRAGADPNIADYNGNTPLSKAAQSNNGYLIDMLLRYGANPSKGPRGASPIETARTKNNVELIQKFEASMKATAHPAISGVEALRSPVTRQRIWSPPRPTKFDYTQAPSVQTGVDPFVTPYSVKLQMELNQAVYTGRNEELQRPPTAESTGMAFENATKAEAIRLFGLAKPVPPETLQRIILLPLPASLFNKFLMEKDKEEDRETAICRSLGPDNLPLLLSLWDRDTSRCTRQKIGEVVNRFIKRNADYIRSLVERQDVQMLYQLARCAVHGDEVPRDLFPFDHNAYDLLCQKVDGSCHKLVGQVISVYYLRTIADTLKAPALNLVVGDPCTSVFALANQLPNIWFCLGSRSCSVSSLMLMVILQLVHNPAPTVTDYIKTQDFINGVRELFRSKHSHTQYAALRILSVMSQEWKSLLFPYYVANPEFIVDDITDPEVTEDLMWAIIRMYLGILDSHTDALQCDNIAFLLGEDLFQRIVQEFNKPFKREHANRLEGLSKLLQKVCDRSFTWKLISVRTNTKSSRPGMRRACKELSVSSTDISKLLSIVSLWMVIPEARTVNACILGALRCLLRHKGVFEAADMLSIVTKLQVFCRDRHEAFNRSAWKFFYDLIKFHPGVIDYLDRNNCLVQFLDIMGTTIHGPSVTANALHYISKVFDLYRAEQRRVAAGLPSHRFLALSGATSATTIGGVGGVGGAGSAGGMVSASTGAGAGAVVFDEKDLRTVEKDIKQLIRIFKNKHLFIKLHMIYKRFCETHPGTAFHELVTLYHLIGTLPECRKLLKDIQMFPDYRTGIQRVSEMFEGPPELQGEEENV